MARILANPNPEAHYTTLNLGPTHPATHGIFQNVLTLDGERIIHAEPTVGYIHQIGRASCRERV